MQERYFEVNTLDKYELNLKMDQIKSLCAEENYESAADIADSINWNKIKNVNTLVKIGEIYEKIGRYSESKELLSMAYDRSPVARTIIYRLAELAIKMQEFENAEKFYHEFVEVAPYDNQRFVLQYDLKRAQGADYSELIPILEELKDQEYTEEWAYELAYLYHKADMADKCVSACDELILWFGDGPYVERALELKMEHQPLNKIQEEKYRKFRLQQQGITTIEGREMEQAGEVAHNTVDIPQVNVNATKFNTVNLQKEIANGIRQIMDATEKGEVSDTMDNIKKIVEEIPYLQIPLEEEKKAPAEQRYIESDEEIDGILNQNFKEILREDSQESVVREQEMLERQITGQLSIMDVLDEWEKTKKAAETALYDAEQRKLESAKARALQEAEDIMGRLNNVIPKLDAGVAPKDLLKEEYMQGVEDEGDFESVSLEGVLPLGQVVPDEPIPDIEPVIIGSHAKEDEQDKKEHVESEDAVLKEKQNDTTVENIETEQTEKVHMPEIDSVEIEFEDIPEVQLEEEPPKAEKETRSMEQETPSAEQESIIDDMNQLLGQEIDRITRDNAYIDSQIAQASFAGQAAPMGPSEEASAIQDDIFQMQSERKNTKTSTLTEEQKAVFTYFIPVKGMEDQLSQALKGVSQHLACGENAYTGNLIIQGGRGCGKTVLATSMIRALQKETGKPNNKVGKINAGTLNKKDIQSLLRKVSGGCLIIERAGELSMQSAVTLSLLLEQEDSGLLVILEDTSKGIRKALSLDEGFARKFTEEISVPIFTNDELVSFANSYSEELGYKIDEMAVLALHKRISNIQKLDQATTLTEVKEIIDEAIAREASSGLRKFFGNLTAKRFSSDDRIILQEKDFEK